MDEQYIEFKVAETNHGKFVPVIELAGLLGEGEMLLLEPMVHDDQGSGRMYFDTLGDAENAARSLVEILSTVGSKHTRVEDFEAVDLTKKGLQ